MYLYEMTDAQLDAAVQAHYDRMYDEYYGVNEPDRECGNCEHWDGSFCSLKENACTQEELDEMDETGDYSEIQTVSDDYCDNHEFKEADYPDWMDGDD